MSRFRHTCGAVVATALLTVTALHAGAQNGPVPEVGVRAQMASITLDQSMLPDGYTFVGETFLTAEQVAVGDVTAQELADAGFVSQYVSVYQNPDIEFEISSYVSAWVDGDSAAAGFDLLEDESRTHPEGAFSDSEAGVGEAPGETTTGIWTDPVNPGATIGGVDTTFRAGRFLVGVSLSARDGSVPDGETVTALSGTLEARATSAANDESPDATDLSLPPQALPLSAVSPSLQAGFLGVADVENMYGVQGSALGGLTASWSEVVALGADGTAPFVSVGLTTFGSEDDTVVVIDQFADLAPDVAGAAPVDGFSVDGADAAVAFQYPSQATGAAEADSFRIAAVSGAMLVVIDVQGAESFDAAQATATTMMSAQLGCLGQTSCEVPDLS